MFDIDTVLYNFFSQIECLNIHNMDAARAALLHFAISAWWAASFSHLIRRHSKWWWLSLPVFVGIVVYQEFFPDGHLYRGVNGMQTEAHTADLRADVITKLAGLIFYLFALL